MNTLYVPIQCTKFRRSEVSVYALASIFVHLYKTTFSFYVLLFLDKQWTNTAHSKWANKHWTREEKRVAIKLWKAGTDLKVIKARLKMPARTLRHIIAINRQTPADIPSV